MMWTLCVLKLMICPVSSFPVIIYSQVASNMDCECWGTVGFWAVSSCCAWEPKTVAWEPVRISFFSSCATSSFALSSPCPPSMLCAAFEFVCAMFADSVLTSFDFIGSSAAFSGSFEYLNDLASNSSTSFVVVAMSWSIKYCGDWYVTLGPTMLSNSA